MIVSKPDIRSSEITPKDLYLRRREFSRTSTVALVGASLGSLACGVLIAARVIELGLDR